MMQIVLMGTIRNGGPLLQSRIVKIERAFNFASRIYWIIIESDSSDGTSETLKAIAQSHPSFEYRSFGDLQQEFPLRTHRLAHCRNHYLEILRNSRQYSEIETVAVVDLDGVNDDLTEAAVLTTFDRADWDCVAANQRDAYFDIWALRANNWCEGDCWRQARFLIDHGLSAQWANLISVYSKMIQIPQDAPWISVNSAFGGLAIYRRSALEGARYEGLTPDNKEVCEHVALHRKIVESGGKIFINPKLVNSGINEHVKSWWELIKSIRST